jgi:hypothetical protein
MEGQVSITSTDAFWNALSAYDTGTALATNESAVSGGSAATSAADASAPSNAATDSAQATAGTLLALLAGPSQSSTSSGADALMSQVLNGQSSSATTAVSAVVNQSILDTLV